VLKMLHESARFVHGDCCPFGKECSWPSNDMIVAETDLWYCFLLGVLPRESRMFCTIDAENGPAQVNGPFRTWLVLQDIKALSSIFEEWLLQ
jgi:hypothetical protein